MPDTCALCGRRLRSAGSRAVGIGPRCARKLAARASRQVSGGQLALALPVLHGYARAPGRGKPLAQPVTDLPDIGHYQPALTN